MISRFASVFILCTTLNVFAGPSTGGGGFVLRCPSNPIEPARVVLLDLYEAEERLGFKLAPSSNDLAQDYFNSVHRVYELQGNADLANQIKEQVTRNLQKFLRATKFVELDSELPVAKDLGETARIPSQCHIKQVAYFSDQSETIYILKNIWDRLDTLSQAALIQHELAYKLMRSLGSKTSREARNHVAHAFSLSGPPPLLERIQPQTRRFFIQGKTLSTMLVTFGQKMGNPVARLQFEQIGSLPLLSNTSVDIPISNWNLKLDFSKNEPACLVDENAAPVSESFPIESMIVENLRLQFQYEKSKAFKISIYRFDGTLMTEGNVTGGLNCMGHAVQ